jgi:hypothetical protein
LFVNDLKVPLQGIALEFNQQVFLTIPMTLDYIDNINAFGENMVRLYGFNKAEAIKFRELIQQTLLKTHKSIDLTLIDFIEPRNCRLMLRIADEDFGIRTNDKVDFYCDLTIEGWEQMVLLLKPFCEKETKGYQWLYELDTNTDFLFSPGGTW